MGTPRKHPLFPLIVGANLLVRRSRTEFHILRFQEPEHHCIIHVPQRRSQITTSHLCDIKNSHPWISVSTHHPSLCINFDEAVSVDLQHLPCSARCAAYPPFQPNQNIRHSTSHKIFRYLRGLGVCVLHVRELQNS